MSSGRATAEAANARPDWGHGPNQPVAMYSEEEIRAAFAAHHPVPSQTMFCSCHQPYPNDFDVDHLLGVLRDARQQVKPDTLHGETSAE